MKVVIVGGVAGGASAAARLRRMDEQAEITLLERGDYVSFANCGLPYYIGGLITDRAAIEGTEPRVFAARHNVALHMQTKATAIDRVARTVSAKNLKTGEEFLLPYDKLVLAPGAEPLHPPLPGAESARVFSLRTIPDAEGIRAFALREDTTSAVIVGGGFIGLEMAENFRRLGLDVTIVEQAAHLLPPFDAEMAQVLEQHLEAKGIRLYLGHRVLSFSETATGIDVLMEGSEAAARFSRRENVGDADEGSEAAARFSRRENVGDADEGSEAAARFSRRENAGDAAGGKVVSASMVLLSVGVRPENTLAKQAGLEIGARGGIVVDETMRTSDPHIYATGDAVETCNFVSGARAQVPLAGPANKQGRIAADALAGAAAAYQGAQGSAVVGVLGMTAAATGLNESALRLEGIPFEKVYVTEPGHAAYYPDSSKMILKLLFHRHTGRVLGAQIAGFAGVDKRCDVIATAIRAGMDVTGLANLELCYAPPFSTVKDAVNIAGYAAENVVKGIIRQYYWEDLDSLPEDITLLDVRKADEFAAGHAEKAVNIPLDELRGRIAELPREKPVYITCQSGRRSYNACRILDQHGYTCYNFAGGFGMYEYIRDTAPPE